MINEEKNINLENLEHTSDVEPGVSEYAEVEYATKKQLNIEASIRADSDQGIRDHFDGKLSEVDDQFVKGQDIVSSIDDKATTNQQNIVVITQSVSDIDGKVDVIDGKVTTINQKVSTLETNLSDYDTRITTLDGKVTATDSQVDTIDGKVTTINQKVSTLETTITDTNDQLNALSGNLSSAQTKITKFETDFPALQTSVDELETDVDEVEIQVKNTDDRVKILETEFVNKVNSLEEEKKQINSDLVDANKTIDEKNQEINKLKQQLNTAGDPDYINLIFNTPPEFQIDDVITVKDFINNYLKSFVEGWMTIRYPESIYGQDYIIKIDGLDYIDIIQGSLVPVIVEALPDRTIFGLSIFQIKIEYNYSDEKMEEFIDKLLKPAIPTSLWGVPENSNPIYLITNEIKNTKPLNLLVNNKDYKSMPFKVFAELNAASYWTDFQRDWQFIINGYVGTGQSTIGANKIINSISDLYSNTSGYYEGIFKSIEKRITESGVPCQITKKLVRTRNSLNVAHHIGNLTFNIPTITLDSDDIFMIQSRQYYILVNFSLKINSKKDKFYRGVALALSDNLELY